MKKSSATALADGTRLLIGAVVAVVCVAGVAAGAAAPWPEIGHGEAAQSRVTTVSGDSMLVCSGSFRVLGRDASSAEEMQSAGSASITVDGVPDAPAQSSIAAPELTGGEGAAVFTGQVRDRQSPLIAASEALVLAEEDVAGLAAQSCGPASTQAWIVGGSTRTGASDVLVLSNPGSVAATVTLTVFGAQDRGTTVVIPAQTQTAVPFVSIAAAAETPIVQVTSEGSPVRAVLQSSLTSVLDPAGVDLQGSTTEASEELLFAGVQVVARSEGAPTDALRLLALDADTTAHVVVRDSAGQVAGEFTAPLTASTPLDLALTDLELGTYSVEVSASTPLVGGVWQSSGDGAGTDFAWTTPAPTLVDETVFAVPSGPEPMLHLVNRSDGDATVTLAPVNGPERSITLAAGASELVSVQASTVYRLAGDGEIGAAVTMSATGQLAGWPVLAGSTDQPEITVYP